MFPEKYYFSFPNTKSSLDIFFHSVFSRLFRLSFTDFSNFVRYFIELGKDLKKISLDF